VGGPKVTPPLTGEGKNRVCHHGDRGVSFYGNSGLGPRLPLVSKFRLPAPEDTCTCSLETHNKKQVCMCHSTVITHIEKPIHDAQWNI